MDGSNRRERVFDGLWFLAFAVASSAWCATASRELGPTFDEPTYVAQGLERWRTGSHYGLMKLGTMPLPVDLDTLPLYLRERWQGVRFDAVGDLDRLLPWARMGTLVFWWLLLAYGCLAGRQLAGPWGGRLAVALLACEPSLLAHAGLATTDIAVSACLLALVYHFRRARESPAPWWWRVAVPAVCFAAAVLSKASSLVFGPICLLAVELERLVSAGAITAPLGGPAGGSGRAWLGRAYAQLKPFRSDFLQIMAGGMALVFIYCGSDWRAEPSFVAWARGLPDGVVGRSMVWLAEHLCVFSNAGHGLVRQMMHNVRGHGVFLLGHSEPRAIWYYFPVALTIKLGVPLLLLPLVLALARPRALLNWACIAAGALLVFSLTCRVQIGIRLVLPLVVLAVVGLAAAAVTACKEARGRWRRVVMAGWLAAGTACTAAAAVTVWPDGLCYTNPLWGGTTVGYLRLSDSNYDWGQGLRELARWERERGLAEVDLWYWGSDPAAKKPPFRELPLQALALRRPEDMAACTAGRVLAVSTTLLYGEFTENPARRCALTFLRARRPAARTPTFLIYDFRGEAAGKAGR